MTRAVFEKQLDDVLAMVVKSVSAVTDISDEEIEGIRECLRDGYAETLKRPQDPSLLERFAKQFAVGYESGLRGDTAPGAAVREAFVANDTELPSIRGFDRSAD